MKTIMYLAMTLNGKIADGRGSIGFSSDNEWNLFQEEMGKWGNIIMGRRTFEVSLKAGVFPYNGLNIVMTKEKIRNRWGESVIFFGGSPAEALRLLDDRGFEIAYIGGGGMLNYSFLKEGLIDEIMVDVEPAVIGVGVGLLAEEEIRSKLKLIDVKRISEDEVQLRYSVIR
ncbi:dihydrofolate reductase family protein [Candidatus Marsarchaeota archaeon]|nr:dihydrofolate reductase family protein [Candidatus Marsarchaeota archaeon]